MCTDGLESEWLGYNGDLTFQYGSFDVAISSIASEEVYLTDFVQLYVGELVVNGYNIGTSSELDQKSLGPFG